MNVGDSYLCSALAIYGAFCAVYKLTRYIRYKFDEYIDWKAKRKNQKDRILYLQNNNRQSNSIKIAQEFAADLANLKPAEKTKPAPKRKATGFYSDKAAQKFLTEV